MSRCSLPACIVHRIKATAVSAVLVVSLACTWTGTCVKPIATLQTSLLPLLGSYSMLLA